MDELQNLIQSSFSKVEYPGDFNLDAADTDFERESINQALHNFWEDAARSDAR